MLWISWCMDFRHHLLTSHYGRWGFRQLSYFLTPLFPNMLKVYHCFFFFFSISFNNYYDYLSTTYGWAKEDTMVFPFLFHLVGLELQFFCFFSSVFCVSITNSSSTYSNNSETMAKYDFYIMICKYLAGLFPPPFWSHPLPLHSGWLFSALWYSGTPDFPCPWS